MTEHIREIYPQTAFIEDIVGPHQPQCAELIRATYLSQYFGHGNQAATDFMLWQAVATPITWTAEDRKEYPFVLDITDRFFSGEGPQQLAEAATAGLVDPQLPAARQTIADRTRAGWEALRPALPPPSIINELPTGNKLLSGEADISVKHSPGLKGVIEKEVGQVRLDVSLLAAIRNFIAVDAAAVANGRQLGYYQGDRYESLVREACLARRPSGSAALNMGFARIQNTTISGAGLPELRALRNAWTAQHPGQAFIPAAFKEAKRSAHFIDKLPAALGIGVCRLFVRPRPLKPGGEL